jgi:hypothetical protein
VGRTRAVGCSFLVILLAGALVARGSSGDPTPADFKVAFIGDQGFGTGAQAVLELIRDEGADAVIHSGDFDYQDDPAAWMAMIDGVLGPDFPYFASVGNHDSGHFYGAGGYQEVLAARMQRQGVPWTGDLGAQSFFHYRGILVVFTAPGVFGSGDADHATFIRDVLAADDSIWKISSWHENMNDMQLGSKGNSTGWGVYEESRRGGAIIATAHEHSYSRTHLLSHVEQKTVASTEQPLVLNADDPGTTEDEGTSFVFVSGLGGHSVRNQDRDGYWWASRYTSDQGATYGALFGVFNHEGDPQLARFYFKDVAGVVADEFFVRSAASASEPTLAIEDVAVVEGDGDDAEAVFQVVLRFADGAEVSVDYATANGTATGGLDYTPAGGRLVFGAGVTEQTLRIPVHGDRLQEEDETFFVVLENPVNAVLASTQGIGTILDDDEAPAVFPLGVTLDGPGRVSLEPPGGLYESGTLVALTATPAPGYGFSGWSGDAGGLDDTTSVLVNAERHVVASFAPEPATFEEVQTGSASESNAVGTSARLEAAEGDLYVAAIVSKPHAAVTAVAGLGLSWSPVWSQCGARRQTGVAAWQARGIPSANDVVAASLAASVRSAVISVSRFSGAQESGPLGNGVSANTAGVSGACSGGTDDAAYAFDLEAAQPGSIVYAAAAMRSRSHAPGPGFTERAEVSAGSTGGNVAGLAVADARVDAPGLVRVSGSFDGVVDWAVLALEIRSPVSYVLSLDATPGGSVRAEPEGFYEPGAQVTLTATPDPGYAFGGWSGDLSDGSNPIGLTMDSDMSVTATFLREYAVTTAPALGGSIDLAPGGGIYLDGTIVTARATPEPGWAFAGWSGDVSGAANPIAFVVDREKYVAAQFATSYSLTIAPPVGGSVISQPPGPIHPAGTVVTLTAFPDPDMGFVGWGGDLPGIPSNPIQFAVTTDWALEADFRRIYSVEVEATTGGSIALYPSGGRYLEGMRIGAVATPDPGFALLEWGGNLSGTESSAALTVDGPKTVSAVFAREILAPPALEEAQTGASSNASAVSTAVPVSQDAGLFVVAVATKPFADVTSLSGLGLGWSPVRAQCGGRKQTGVSVWVASGQPAGDGLVVAQLSRSATNAVIAVSRYSGAGASASESVGSVTSANTLGVLGGCSGGQDGRAYSLDLDSTRMRSVVHVAAAARARDHSPGPGFTERAELFQGPLGGDTAGLSIADAGSEDPGRVDVSGEFSGNVDWAVVAVEILPAD